MTLRKAHIGIAIILAFLSLVAVVLGNQREVYADTLAEDIICETYAALQAAGEPIPAELESACGGGDSDGGNGGGDVPDVPVDPCDIFDELGNLPPNCDGGGGGEEPTDVCPNIDGAQESVPEGKVLVDDQCVDEDNGGGGGGSNPACSDGTDNDADGKIDMEDPGCANSGDSDEADPVSGGGSGGGGGGGGGGGSVLGTSTPAYLEGVTSCDMYLTDFLKKGGENKLEQVQRLQDVLKKDGFEVEVNGVFDDTTHAAVLAFQGKYAEKILMPWGLTSPTGFVYLTTRKQVNEIYCEGKEFPLSTDEQSIVETGKVGGTVQTAAVRAIAPALKAPAAPVENAGDDKGEGQREDAGVVTLPSNRISDFFRRMFDRFW